MRNKICLGLIALILVVGEFFWPEIKNAILFEHQSSGVDDGNICPSSRSLAIPKSAEEKTDTVLNPGVLGNPLGETILNKIANASSTLEDKKHPKNVFPAQGSAKINWFPANPRTGDNEEEGNGEKEEVQDDDQGMSLNSLLKSFSCTDVHSYNSSSTREGARNFLSEKSILERTSACSSYPRLMSSLNLSPATAEERDFPLAFAFTVHEDIGILELMLSLLFRPSDVHCIHVDKKADPEVRAAVQGLVDCYRQLFGQAASRILMAEQPVSVTWRHGGTIMEADRICYRELQRFRDWRYLINLAGTELPTVSIQRMRELLKREGGGRVVMDMTANHYFRVRQTFHYQPNKEGQWRQASFKHPGPPPCDLFVIKGFKYGAFPQSFIDVSLDNPFSKHLYEWLYPTKSPDEAWQQTLATLTMKREGGEEQLVAGHSNATKWRIWQRFDESLSKKEYNVSDNSWTQDPSSCFREYLYDSQSRSCSLVNSRCPQFEFAKLEAGKAVVNYPWPKGLCMKAVIWRMTGEPCHGNLQHSVCHLSTKDLDFIRAKACLVANKFDLALDPAAIFCQIKRTWDFTKNYVPGVAQDGV